jgi:hypothetical protein
MIEESLNSLEFFLRKLIDWQFEKSLNNSLQLYSHSRRPQNGFVPTCIAFEKINVEKNGNTWRELKLGFGLISLHTFMQSQVKKTPIGGVKLVFASKLVQKSIWHPIIFSHKVFIPCCCSLHPLSSLNWPFWFPVAPTL